MSRFCLCCWCEAAIGVLFSAWLTYVELAVIHAICIWCVTSAGIVVAILLVSIADLGEVRASRGSIILKQGALGFEAKALSSSVGVERAMKSGFLPGCLAILARRAISDGASVTPVRKLRASAYKPRALLQFRGCPTLCRDLDATMGSLKPS